MKLKDNSGKCSVHKPELCTMLFNICPDPITIIQDQKIIQASPSFLTTFGYSESDISDGLPLKTLLNHKELKRANEKYQDVIADKISAENFKVSAITKDGTTLRLEARSRKLDYNGRPAIMAIARDVTERYNTENALRESEQHFKDIAEQSPNMIFINAKGHTVFINEQSEKLLGIKPEYYKQPGFDVMKHIEPLCTEKSLNAIDEILNNKGSTTFEQNFINKHGQVLNTIVTAKFISYQAEPAVLGIVTDITARKNTERKLAAATRNLTEQKKELENKNAALNEILAQIENEKLQVRRQLSKNIDQLLKPVLKHLKKHVTPSQLRYINIIDETLNELTSDFGIGQNDLSSLSPRQLEICNMIRNGMPNKEMADILGVSVRTVEVHRNNIRKKLGLSGKGTNLFAFLTNTATNTTYI